MNGPMQGGYVALLIREGPTAKIVDPYDPDQRARRHIKLEDVIAVVFESPAVFRRHDSRLWLTHIESGEAGKFLPGERMVKLAPGEFQNWSLRPMGQVTIAPRGEGWVVTSMEGIQNQREARNLPLFDNLRLRKSRSFIPIPFERISEITKEMVSVPPQLEEIQNGGLLLARIVSVFEPLLWGFLQVISGPPSSGKTFAWRMIYFLLAWVLLKEVPNLHIIVSAVGERDDELEEFQAIAESSNRIELFGTVFSDVPSLLQVDAAEAAVNRTRRRIELGEQVFLLLDSATRFSNAWSNADTTGNPTTGGVSTEGQESLRKALGVAGNYSLHERTSKLPGWDGSWYDSPPTCTLVVTVMDGTPDRADGVIAHNLAGTGNSRLGFTDQGGLDHPKLDLRVRETRNTRWVKFPSNFIWFAQEVAKRMNDHATVGGRFNPRLAVEFLTETFGPKDASVERVMSVWVRGEMRNALFRRFNSEASPMTSEVTDVLVNRWNLSEEQVFRLIEAGFGKGILELHLAGGKSQVIRFLDGAMTATELLQFLKAWQARWSNDGYTRSLNRWLSDNKRPQKADSLNNPTCDQFRDGGVDADLFYQLLSSGFEVPQIKEVLSDGATAQALREKLRRTPDTTREAKEGGES